MKELQAAGSPAFQPCKQFAADASRRASSPRIPDSRLGIGAGKGVGKGEQIWDESIYHRGVFNSEKLEIASKSTTVKISELYYGFMYSILHSISIILYRIHYGICTV